MGDLAHLVGVRPWEYDLLTVWDYYALCDIVQKTNEEMSKHG